MSIKNKKAIQQQISQIVEIFNYFLKLGVTSFGGPLAVLGILHRDLVEKRAWMKESEFTQAFTMIKAMPGPISFMMSTYIGRRRGGLLGGFAAAIAFVLPAFCMILLLAEYYQRFEHIEMVRKFIQGLQISAFALILYAMKTLVQKDYKNPVYVGFCVLSAVVFYFGWLPEPLIILGFGIFYAMIRHLRRVPPATLSVFFFDFDERYWVLLSKCLKAGALVFGTGFAILPVLRNDFVVDLKWISEAEFLNALAFGQMTPGPVVITTTYIGYKILGISGATLATIGVFAPCFFHIQTWFVWALDKLQKMKWIHDFILASSAAVAGTLFVTLFTIGGEIKWNGVMATLFLASLAIYLFVKKIPSLAVMLAAGFLSMFLS